MSKQNSTTNLSRRTFLGGAAVASAFMIVPRHVLGGPGYTPPSDKLNIGCVGVGGKGRSDTESVAKENVVALCDVDDTMMAGFKKAAKSDG
ncbi:twin-arginine translocation signal domain-containing protein, partial [candidate division KSB1 bacterium]|nr:twin-arginine translocation signal domain-containing protein [candidate division KSB1 bacterium]